MLRTAPWLTAHRATAWCRVLAIATSLLATAWIALSHHGLDLTGKPLGTDFLCFWTAARLALHGHAEAAYNPLLSAAAQYARFPSANTGYTAFFYPPTFLLLALPLGLPGYAWSLALWLAAGIATVVAMLRTLLSQRWALLPILAFPGLLVNAGHGQNGCLTAACLGATLVLGLTRPFLTGLCLGLLACKPHLLVAAPVALIAARRWRTLAGLATSATLLTAATWPTLGSAAWAAFRHTAPIARAALETGALGPEKMPSVFAALLLLHAPPGAAYLAQAATATAALATLATACARRPGPAAEGALLICATLFCTPYLFDYDLVCLAFPLAWTLAQAQRTGFLAWEKITLLAAYLLPLLARAIGGSFGVPIAPLVLLAVFLVVRRRSKEALLF